MSLEEMLASLRQEYLDSLPDKIAQLLIQVENASAAELAGSFHKLKGTGRTYGLPEVSQLAEVVENICNQSPGSAPEAVRIALAILKDIHRLRADANSLDLAKDLRFQKIRQLLSCV